MWHLVDIALHDLHAPIQAECPYAVPEEVSPLGPTFHQNAAQRWSTYSYHEPRKTPAGPEVKQCRHGGGQGDDEMLGVRNGVLDWTAADTAAALNLAENSNEFVSHSPVRSPHTGADHRLPSVW